ncbi:MAG: 6-bladed beta-propeller [Balneolaceae bacterium]
MSLLLNQPNNQNLLIVFLFLVLCVGCTSQESIDIPDHIKTLENLTVYTPETDFLKEIQFKKEQVFGDSDDVLIGEIWDVAIGDSGQVFIADSKEMNIKTYEPDGHLLNIVGRRGNGPGELQEISGIQVKGNQLFVFDRNQKIVIVFSDDLYSYDHSVTITDNRESYDEILDAYLANIYVRSNYTYLKEFSKSKIPENINDWDKFRGERLYYLLGEDGEIISDKLFEVPSGYQVLVPFEGRSTGLPVEFYGKNLTQLSNDDHIYNAWSDDFLIKVYTPDGGYKQAFYYPFEKFPLDPATAFGEAGDDFIREAVRSINFPETWPALNDLLIDDENRLWVSTIVEDFEVYEWWVLENSGELITKFTWPRNEPIEEIKNGYMYTRETDEETGLQQVVRYRVEMN